MSRFLCVLIDGGGEGVSLYIGWNMFTIPMVALACAAANVCSRSFALRIQLRIHQHRADSKNRKHTRLSKHLCDVVCTGCNPTSECKDGMLP